MRQTGMMVVLALMSIAPARAEPLLNIQSVKSPSGLTAWLVEDHSIPVLSVEFGFRGAGSVNEVPQLQGLARMLSNTLDEGAGDLDSQVFQKTLRDKSISLFFNADRDNFGGSLKTLTANKDTAFSLLNLALTKPRFDEEPVARMREANRSRIRSSLSDPEWMAARILNDRAFAGHPYGLNSGGTLTSLENITPDALRAFHAAHLGKNNLVIAVAGDISAAELGAALDTMFAGLPDLPAPAPAKALDKPATGTVQYKADIPQTIIEILQPGIDRKDPDYFAAEVMNHILGAGGFGSRLMNEIREKRGLTYGIYTSFWDMNLFDGLAISTSTENANVATLLSLLTEQWKAIKSAPVSAQELSDAKAYLIGSVLLGLSSTDRIAGFMKDLQLDNLPPDYLDHRAAAIERITPAAIQKIAQRVLDENAMMTVLVGNPALRESYPEIKVIPNAE